MVSKSDRIFGSELIVFLLRGSVAVLSKQAAANQMVPHLTGQFRAEFGYSPPRSEVLSWERSIPPLLGQLSDVGLDEVEVLVEYQLRGTAAGPTWSCWASIPRAARRAWWWRTNSGAASGWSTSSTGW